jgi:hypothetical protein
MAAERLTRIALIAWWALLAAATVAASAIIAYVGAVDAPYADEWIYTNPDHYLRPLTTLFTKHGQHPFIIGRLGLALDYWLFDAHGWALRALTLVLSALIVCAAALLVRPAESDARWLRGVFVAFAVVIIFSPQGIQNFTWGFQFTFVLAFAAAIGAFPALARYAVHEKPWLLVVAMTLSAISTLSLANGVITPLLLVLMAWRLGLPARVIKALALLTVLSWIAYAFMPTLPVGRGLPLEHVADMPPYALRVLGSGPIDTISALLGWDRSNLLIPAALIGAMLAALSLFLSWNAVVATPRDPTGMAGAAIILFALGTAALVGIGRADARPELALESRYTLISATLILGIGVLIAHQLARTSPITRLVSLAVAALAFSAIPATAPAQLDQATQSQTARVRAQTALVVGLNKIQPLALIIRPEWVFSVAPDLRRHEKSLFSDRWSRSLGQRLDVGDSIQTCRGTSLRVSAPLPDDPDFVRVQGRLGPATRRQGRLIVITDPDGVISGYGLAPRRVSDLLLPFGAADDDALWLGTALTTRDNAAYRAYLATPERVLCAIASAPADRTESAP